MRRNFLTCISPGLVMSVKCKSYGGSGVKVVRLKVNAESKRR
jgi:hypothetical protein